MTAYEMRISDWSSDVCSSDLDRAHARLLFLCLLSRHPRIPDRIVAGAGHGGGDRVRRGADGAGAGGAGEARAVGAAVAAGGGARPGHARARHASSAARRVGNECVSTCRSRWSRYHIKKKKRKKKES